MTTWQQRGSGETNSAATACKALGIVLVFLGFLGGFVLYYMASNGYRWIGILAGTMYVIPGGALWILSDYIRTKLKWAVTAATIVCCFSLAIQILNAVGGITADDNRPVCFSIIIGLGEACCLLALINAFSIFKYKPEYVSRGFETLMTGMPPFGGISEPPPLPSAMRRQRPEFPGQGWLVGVGVIVLTFCATAAIVIANQSSFIKPRAVPVSRGPLAAPAVPTKILPPAPASTIVNHPLAITKKTTPPHLPSIRPYLQGKSLAGKTDVIDNAVATEIELADVSLIEWSLDQKYALMLDRRRYVCKVALVNQEEERELDLGESCIGMARTAAGFMVATNTRLRLLDENLDVVSETKLNGRNIISIVSSPLCGRAFALKESGGRKKIVAIDLKNGSTFDPFDPSLNYDLQNIQHIAMTPDGRHLFLATGGNASDEAFRFSINETQLRFEERKPDIGFNCLSISISGNSQYVVFPSAGDTDGAVYEVTNLTNKVATLDDGKAPEAFAFDDSAQLFYFANFGHTLTLVATDGRKLRDYDLGERLYPPKTVAGRDGQEITVPNFITTRFRVHPAGRKLFMITDGPGNRALHKTFWITLN